MSQLVGNTALAYHRGWHTVDAQGRTLGKLATSIAKVLMGKHKPIYDKGVDCGDYVTVTNATQVVTSGQKDEQKVYRHHTMFPGGLKEIPYKDMMAKKPHEILRRAVSGMLPKNKLRERRLERLHIFPDTKNPFASNVMWRWDDPSTHQLSTSSPSSSSPAADASASQPPAQTHVKRVVKSPIFAVGIKETMYDRKRRFVR